uniref:Uncharacterized protein n=1 Tax=Timema bartmani TaxID=61472 RepID=A0A7R9EX20_9NEOP|nr:unnamed protein product [Timema bartmani]
MVFLLDSMCRLCMSQEGILYPIFFQDGSGGPTHNLPGKIMTFAAVKVFEGDGLPTLICQQCIHQVNRSYDFKMQCERSDAMLRQYANNTNSFQHSISGPQENAPATNGGGRENCELVSGSSNGSASSVCFTHESPESSSGGSMTYVLQELVPMKLEKESPLTNMVSLLGGNEPSNGYILQDLAPPPLPPWRLTPNTPQFTGYTSTTQTQTLVKEEIKTEPSGDEERDMYQCPLCDKSFDEGKHFEGHIRSHMGSGNVCPVCHKQFAGNNSLRVHVGIHARVKPHACPTCGKCFAQKGQLKVHTRLHTGERPYECHICQAAFFQMVSLSNHIKRNHTGETPFKCMLCGKSFPSKSVLTGHINIHTRRYECPVCRELFTRKKYLSGHLKLRHAKS